MLSGVWPIPKIEGEPAMYGALLPSPFNSLTSTVRPTKYFNAHLSVLCTLNFTLLLLSC